MQIDDRVAEHLAPAHPQFADGARGRWPAVDIQHVVMAPVGVQPGRQYAAIGGFGRAQHDRPRAIAEQHAGRAILPVEDA